MMDRLPPLDYERPAYEPLPPSRTPRLNAFIDFCIAHQIGISIGLWLLIGGGLTWAFW